MAAKLVADGAVPGIAIVVVHADEVVYLGGFGLREVGKPETVDADTVFQLASMSKPISATVVAKLVSDGVVGWDSRIADLNPAFQLHDPFPTAEVTVTDLLNHRSGLPGTSGDDLEAIGFDRETIAARLRLVPPSSSFRAGYAYSNAGFTQGALAAAMPTGKSWEEVAEERLYRPLGMAATSSRHSDFVARPNRAALHVPSQGGWAALATREPDAQAPAGGVSASVRDLAQWLRLELGTGDWDGAPFIDADALAATHEPLFDRGSNPVSGAASFYGRGWNAEFGRHGRSWGHAGAFSTGARTLVTLYPDAGLGIVVLTNAFPTGVPEGIADSFFDLVFDGSVSQGLGRGLGRGVLRPVRPGDRGGQGDLRQPAAAADRGAAGRELRRQLRQRLRRRGDGDGRRRDADGAPRAGRRHRLAADPLRPRPLPLPRRAGDARHAVGRPLRRRPGRPRHRADPRVARLERPRDADATVGVIRSPVESFGRREGQSRPGIGDALRRAGSLYGRSA